MKGIILAGGFGTRLSPMTVAVSKQILPVYDKPMIYYPLSILLQAKIKEILLISTSEHINFYKTLFGNGERLGINLQYKVQPTPNGIAGAMTLGEDFIKNDNFCLILGDNIFYNPDMRKILNDAKSRYKGAAIFTSAVSNPSDFGIVELDSNHEVVSIEEKPMSPKSDQAIPGLYFFNNEAMKIAKDIPCSNRGEKEITDVLKKYLEQQNLVAIPLTETKWFDTGTPDGLIEASQFIRATQAETKSIIACIEKIAWENGWISNKQLLNIDIKQQASEYGKYVLSLAGD